MSPIKHPEHYPPDWEKIRERILKRSRGRCECRGECGKSHDWDLPQVSGPNDFIGNRCRRRNGDPIPNNPERATVLTVAHLDHDAGAGDHSPENLKAMCQGCHLRYDGSHRREEKRREESGQERLPSLADTMNEERKQLALTYALGEFSTTDNQDGTFTHTWKPREESMKRKITDGHTEDGTHVEVWCDEEVPNYGGYTVAIDGQPVSVLGASRLRDGGTTFVTLASGQVVRYPRNFGDSDRITRLDGQPIEEGE